MSRRIIGVDHRECLLTELSRDIWLTNNHVFVVKNYWSIQSYSCNYYVHIWNTFRISVNNKVLNCCFVKISVSKGRRRSVHVTQSIRVKVGSKWRKGRDGWSFRLTIFDISSVVFWQKKETEEHIKPSPLELFSL